MGDGCNSERWCVGRIYFFCFKYWMKQSFWCIDFRFCCLIFSLVYEVRRCKILGVNVRSWWVLFETMSGLKINRSKCRSWVSIFRVSLINGHLWLGVMSVPFKPIIWVSLWGGIRGLCPYGILFVRRFVKG